MFNLETLEDFIGDTRRNPVCNYTHSELAKEVNNQDKGIFKFLEDKYKIAFWRMKDGESHRGLALLVEELSWSSDSASIKLWNKYVNEYPLSIEDYEAALKLNLRKEIK